MVNDLINAFMGPSEMSIPPQKPRNFMTKTCTVQSRCRDVEDAVAREYFDGSNCEEAVAAAAEEAAAEADYDDVGEFCGNPEVLRVCPKSCGICEGERNPSEFEAVSIFYHGHVLTKEMYATLTPGDGRFSDKIDLRSRRVWNYNDQASFPYEPAINIRVGDRITTTCVYDSTGRDSHTKIDLSTYDEMCLNTLVTVFDTPSLDNGSGVPSYLETLYRGFECRQDETGDIWQGDLDPNEDARDIETTHPLEDADCSFPTSSDAVPTFQVRCFGKIVDKTGLCGDRTSEVLDAFDVAGYSCSPDGELFGYRDSNDGTTKEQCEGDGEVWTPYTCLDVQNRLQRNSAQHGGGGAADTTDADLQSFEFARRFWWEDKCCDGNGDTSGATATTKFEKFLGPLSLTICGGLLLLLGLFTDVRA